jgi:hypothetical protein
MVAAAALGFGAGQALFLPLLKLFFAALVSKWGALPADQTTATAFRFGIALGCLWATIPFSSLVTERFAVRARYAHALAKSLVFGALAFVVALFYQHERLASLERMAAKMPGLFGANQPLVALADDPLTKIVWFTVICLIVFGPADLWIAHLQKQRRKTVIPA